MLKTLEIRQFALIEHLLIEFDAGLNLLTGETGSGKSIIVDALGLLLGEKGFTEMIRTGADKAVVSGMFEIVDDDRIRKRFEECGLDFQPDELILRRELSSNGRGRAFANNQMVPTGFLKDIGALLADIHGQNEQQALFQSESQLAFVDANASLDGVLVELAAIYDEWVEVSQKIELLKVTEQERLRSMDLFLFQLGEIEKLGLKDPGEGEQLQAEERLLANAEKRHHLASQAYADLYEAEESAGAAVKRAIRQMEELSRLDPQCVDLLEELRSSKAAIEEAAFSLREYRSRIEPDPERLEQIASRLSDIDRLKRKYGNSISEILEYHRRIKNELDEMENAEEAISGLEKRQLDRAELYKAKATVLSERRKAAAHDLEVAVEKELSQLAMQKCNFSVQFAPIPIGADRPSGAPRAEEKRNGIDHVEFLLSPNPGEDMKPLAKIASGGEVSRIMLALKSIKTVDGRSKSLVFDEVDAGIGGQTADTIGRKLKRIARKNQVICVTHLAQIASYADSHYLINKKQESGRTLTHVTRLNSEQRVHEIARMISGEKKTESILKHAAELLKSAAK